MTIADELKLWRKRDHRSMSNVFTCPHCGRECYCNHPVQNHKTNRRANICDYKFCPHCGKIVHGSEL